MLALPASYVPPLLAYSVEALWPSTGNIPSPGQTPSNQYANT